MYDELKANGEELFRLESLRAYHSYGSKMYKELTQDIKRLKRQRKEIKTNIQRQKAIERAENYKYKRQNK